MRTFSEKPKATQQTMSTKSTMPPAHFWQSREANSILNLQRTIGNHAVQRMLEANPVDVKGDSTTTESARFGHDFSRIPIHPPTAGVIQTKLAINKPGDEYEQEADRVADHVMRTRDFDVEQGMETSHKPPMRIQRLCTECEDEQLQRQAGPEEETQTTPVSGGFESDLRSLIGGGQRLGPDSRAFFEPRFGHDFSEVRLHTGDRAAAAAKSIAARAFTFGNHVVMSAGEYQPDSRAGKKLLAHELTHVVQQRQVRTSAIQRQPSPPTPLPSPKKDKTTLSKGEMSWELKAVSQRKADIAVDFKPDKSKVDATSVAFAQTIKAQFGATPAYQGGPLPYGNKTTYGQYEETTGKGIDHFAEGENDPFYGAKWDQSAKKWITEGATWGKPGKSTKGTSSESTKLHDAPEFIDVRKGHGDFEISFESVAMAQETREPLGALTWGYKVKDKADSPIVLTGADKSDCIDAPSASFGRALDKFYEAKLDVILDSFSPGSHALTAAHQGKLDTVATKLKADATLQVQLGGAADLKEANAQTVSEKRADAAKAYLVSKGVTNTITIESYGSDWARAQTSKGKDESKNRRVQVWVHK